MYLRFFGILWDDPTKASYSNGDVADTSVTHLILRRRIGVIDPVYRHAGDCQMAGYKHIINTQNTQTIRKFITCYHQILVQTIRQSLAKVYNIFNIQLQILSNILYAWSETAILLTQYLLLLVAICVLMILSPGVG